jgi:hypothetical protein
MNVMRQKRAIKISYEQMMFSRDCDEMNASLENKVIFHDTNNFALNVHGTSEFRTMLIRILCIANNKTKVLYRLDCSCDDNPALHLVRIKLLFYTDELQTSSFCWSLKPSGRQTILDSYKTCLIGCW